MNWKALALAVLAVCAVFAFVVASTIWWQVGAVGAVIGAFLLGSSIYSAIAKD